MMTGPEPGATWPRQNGQRGRFATATKCQVLALCVLQAGEVTKRKAFPICKPDTLSVLGWSERRLETMCSKHSTSFRSPYIRLTSGLIQGGDSES